MLTKKQIVTGLHQIGLKEGQVVLVHAAQRTFGPVQGGADTVVAALLADRIRLTLRALDQNGIHNSKQTRLCCYADRDPEAAEDAPARELSETGKAKPKEDMTVWI